MKKRYFAGAAVAAMILTAGMATTSFADWSQQNGKWYYYNDNNGRLVRNDWVCSKDAWYYMDYNGVMQTNSLIDDTYYVNENGVEVHQQQPLERERMEIFWSERKGVHKRLETDQ